MKTESRLSESYGSHARVDSYEYLKKSAPISPFEREALLLRRGNTSPPVLRGASVVEAEFARRCAMVHAETEFSSSQLEVAINPNYQAIIGLGLEVVPLLLRETKDSDSSMWLWALAAVVGFDVASHSESPDGASARWVDWGRENGYM